ncbi:DUF1294 domain-containing protein [Halomonas sp. LS-001]
MALTGRIIFWDDAKGYGFIETEAGGERVFVHISAFQEEAGRPGQGRKVVFEEGTDKHGKLRAEKATLTGFALPGLGALVRYARRPGGRAVVLALVFLGGLAALVYWQWLPLWVPVAYGVVSVVTLLMYSRDKAAALKDKQRTPEKTLHLLALLGGWPGAMVAQQSLRHKSQKRSFRRVYWLTVVINLAVLGSWIGTQWPPSGG